MSDCIRLTNNKKEEMLLYIEDGYAVVERVGVVKIWMPPNAIVEFARVIMDSPEVGTDALNSRAASNA